MEIVVAYPPNIKEIEAAFDLTDRKPVFTYGKILFNPHGATVDQFLLAHELTHVAQQGDNVIEWWHKYITDPQFRLSQEVEAYHAQYQAVMRVGKDRNRIARYLSKLAVDLSSPLYGKMCSYQEALHFIRYGNR